jgi:hypothetical protein
MQSKLGYRMVGNRMQSPNASGRYSINKCLANIKKATPRGSVESGIFSAFEDESYGAASRYMNSRLDSLVRITLPTNMDERHLAEFEASFINFWKNQNKAGGTYVKNGRIWTRQ